MCMCRLPQDESKEGKFYVVCVSPHSLKQCLSQAGAGRPSVGRYKDLMMILTAFCGFVSYERLRREHGLCILLWGCTS